MKFLNDIVLTGAGADLTAPATVTFSGLSATTETNAVVINSSGVLSKRALGSNAFNSTTIPTGVVFTTGNQTIAGVKTFTGALTVGVDDAGHDVMFRGNTSGAYFTYDASEDGVVIVAPTDEVALGIRVIGGAQATVPQFQVGRGTSQYLGIKVDDRVSSVIHRQDETSGIMKMNQEIWDNGNGIHQWNWVSSNGSGASPSIKMTLDKNGKLDVNGEVECNSLDVDGNADISGNLTGVDAFTASGKIQGAELEGTSLDINGNGDVSGTLNVTGSITTTGAGVNGNLYANRYFQSATGVPTNNLGAPTVTEMALFENQFKPQTTLANAYDNLADLKFFTRAEGTSESDYSEVDKTDDQKRKFLRTNNSACYITNGHNSFRVEFVAHNYTFANAMVAYWSSESHRSKVQVYKRRCSDNVWIQHTSSDVTVSSWPGHLYLPFGTIPWHETNTSSTGHYNKIRIEFTPTWIPYSGSGSDYSDRTIKIYGMQIWGGYPSGRRTVHSYDQNGKLDLFKDLGLPDNGVATFGNGDDLKIYHDGSNSYIEESGSGNLKIRTSALNVMNAANSENMLSAAENGAVTLYHNNASKLTTVAAGVEITGELQADTLDIDGNADISGTTSLGNALTITSGTNAMFTHGSASNGKFHQFESYWSTNMAGSTSTYRFDTGNWRLWSAGTSAAILSATAAGNFNFAHDVTIAGGDLILGGTGRIQGIDTVTASTDAASKAYVDGAVIANTDTQDLSISGQTLSLTNGGSVTLPDTNTVYTHPTSAGNKHIPTGGESGQFLKYTSSGTAVWATPSYTTNTNTQNSAATTRGFFSGTGVNTSTGVITNTTYAKATASTAGLVTHSVTDNTVTANEVTNTASRTYQINASAEEPLTVNVPWTVSEGPRGSTGSTGERGATGAKGDTGDTGSAGSNGSNGSNGSAGSDGSDGDRGPTGNTGPTGSRGPTGNAGSNGNNGSNGSDGDTGSAGARGATGSAGARGATGSAGAAGALAITEGYGATLAVSVSRGVYTLTINVTHDDIEGSKAVSFTLR